MAKDFANIIVDISHEQLDRIFQYRIPEALKEKIRAGMQVAIPFGRGNRKVKGYVVGFADTPDYDSDKIKDIAGIVAGSISVESQLIQLAWWMKEQYGSTMNQALKTVLPVKQKIKEKEKKTICLLTDQETLFHALKEAERRKYKARARLLHALVESSRIPFEAARDQLSLTPAVWNPLVEQGIIKIEANRDYRNPLGNMQRQTHPLCLNQEQQEAVDGFWSDYSQGSRKTCLLHGITGSGKTEVYMELIERVLAGGRQAIVLIPEIALTYQTVMRFYKRFGNQVSIMNSRLSAGERYDQFERARNGEIQIMIGPRSALFTPFPNLGLIVMDEEHEGAYKSEISPRYHARETAIHWAGMNDAAVVLGSATPSMEAYSRALQGQYTLYSLHSRAKAQSSLAKVEIVDLRQELKAGNKSIFSKRLMEEMLEKLGAGQQIMLFINRRGYSSFISCRSCGEAIRCPHCDVSMTYHRDGTLVCHYCGYRISMPNKCPSCSSPYIAGFGTGTQKIEEQVRQLFPQARILRMDLDTTSKKGGHDEILSSFAAGEADILIGTQMIVKGHDFPKVTLVGVLAADVSLHAPDFRSSERTFQLLTQAAGRAGRDQMPGSVVIQTYKPEHYSITCAANQDYEAFYNQEMAYRRILNYPPSCVMLTIQAASKSEEKLDLCALWLEQFFARISKSEKLQVIGPAEAAIYKINDIYRKILYIKQENYDILIQIKNRMEAQMSDENWLSSVVFQYDFS